MSPKKRIRKVLVANRGEIAVRVMRTCREMGLATVAVYSDADRGALHVRKADEAVHIGPSPARDSYLVVEKVIDAAKKTGADAIHPGYGFLSERAELARAVEAAGITFIGPTAESMDAMGVKTTARRNMNAAGVPTVPGSEGPIADEQEARAFADALGYPVMIKAAAGGGGKGMKKVEREADFPRCGRPRGASPRPRSATPALPREVPRQAAPRRDPGVRRRARERHPSRRARVLRAAAPAEGRGGEPELRARRGAAREDGRGGRPRGEGGGLPRRRDGRVPPDARRDFYFLEMNTRLQVEHPVTEMITGLDLVRMQIEVARGERLVAQDEPSVAATRSRRIYAEDPARRFMPSPGKITYLRVPGGPGIRDDSGVYTAGSPQFYDLLISKLVAWAPTRDQAIERLIRALGEYTVHGITTNVAYLAAVLDHPGSAPASTTPASAASTSATSCARPTPPTRTWRSSPRPSTRSSGSRRGGGVRRLRGGGAGLRLDLGAARARPRAAPRWKVSAYVALLDGGKREETIEVRQTGPGSFEVKSKGVHVADAFEHDYGTLSLIVDTASYTAMLDQRDVHVRVRVKDSVYPIEILDEKKLRMRRAAARFTVEGRQTLTAPMPGRIVRVLVKAGDEVEGQGLVVVEAMKMENEMKSPKGGRSSRSS